jgi:hypothetical protein
MFPCEGRQPFDRLQSVRLDTLEQNVDALIDERQLHFCRSLRWQQGGQQTPERIDQSEQLGPQDVAFSHVDDPVRLLGVEAANGPLPDFQRPKRCPATAVRWGQMRFATLGREPVLHQRRFDARSKIRAVRIVIGMLELAAAAFRKMAARRLLVMGTECERAIIKDSITWNRKRSVAAAWRHAVTARRNANDRLVHREAKARGIAQARSSAIIVGPAISADRPWSQTAPQAASKAGTPLALSAAIIPDKTSPVPALASHEGAGGANPVRPSGAATTVSGPL